MTLTTFGLMVSAVLDQMMFKKTADSPDPLLTSVLHEYGRRRVLLTADVKDGTVFRVTIEKVKP